MQGKIIKGVGGSYIVRCDGRDYTCHAKGILRYRNQKPLIGDMVIIEPLKEEPGMANILEILPRANALIRPAVANVDQAIIEFAAKDPVPNANLLDRFLIRMEEQEVPVKICINKIDLVRKEELSAFADIYRDIGYQVFPVSAVTGEGLEDLKHVLRGKTTVWAGPSGVGKSSLINMLTPESIMETGIISEKIRRGKHTTRHVQLLDCGDNTYVCDTPGFSSIDLPDIKPEKLQFYFGEFGPFISSCRFKGCVHIGERECGVKDAVREGFIHRERYENYRLFYMDLKNRKKY